MSALVGCQGLGNSKMGEGDLRWHLLFCLFIFCLFVSYVFVFFAVIICLCQWLSSSKMGERLLEFCIFVLYIFNFIYLCFVFLYFVYYIFEFFIFIFLFCGSLHYLAASDRARARWETEYIDVFLYFAISYFVIL